MSRNARRNVAAQIVCHTATRKNVVKKAVNGCKDLKNLLPSLQIQRKSARGIRSSIHLPLSVQALIQPTVAKLVLHQQLSLQTLSHLLVKATLPKKVKRVNPVFWESDTVWYGLLCFLLSKIFYLPFCYSNVWFNLNVHCSDILCQWIKSYDWVRFTFFSPLSFLYSLATWI